MPPSHPRLPPHPLQPTPPHPKPTTTAATATTKNIHCRLQNLGWGKQMLRSDLSPESWRRIPWSFLITAEEGALGLARFPQLMLKHNNQDPLTLPLLILTPSF